MKKNLTHFKAQVNPGLSSMLISFGYKKRDAKAIVNKFWDQEKDFQKKNKKVLTKP